ncbi:hypothetical protein [Amycolatopsis vancoresmycina]|uniref:Uncharacterized protein n=1 Tax=Amycolatopsis vancoresmycina DSM 44592 TaxID=1292037 RepID=R1HGZ1_9PSEU|nr:hypothetical protein [Amycolatopsis vancoresmycina]EOD59671.1 hypothetical protein H480_41550 [Amycolatopsis vancoresmycina DSM 44592]
MLYIVLVLVLAALGLLVTALITASSLWAWVSIGLSVLAGLILIADWLRRRRRPAPAPKADVPAEPPAEAAPEPEPAKPAEEEQTTLIPAAGDLGDPAAVEEPDASAEPEPKADSEPGVEETPDADIAVLADLEDEVVVVDEHPRYHLRTCPWLGTRDLIPIGVGEARQLGFTPCATCTPDATLVAAHR